MISQCHPSSLLHDAKGETTEKQVPSFNTLFPPSSHSSVMTLVQEAMTTSPCLRKERAANMPCQMLLPWVLASELVMVHLPLFVICSGE